jgi:flagellar biosynthesis protein FlhF
VGKTTTIAKIAAQERARTRRPVALVAADGFRPGAVDQLRCYANVLGAPFRAARSASELGAALMRRVIPRSWTPPVDRRPIRNSRI